VAENVFGRLPPFVAARATTFALRAAGVSIGRASVFWGMPQLVGRGNVSSRLSVGTYCGFNARCYFELDDRIAIGDHVAVGQDVMFLTRTYDTSNPEQRGGNTSSAPIEVGNGAWLGARCIIMPGVKIGPGSVIGASVVVTKDVPANILLMGSRSISLAKWRWLEVSNMIEPNNAFDIVVASLQEVFAQSGLPAPESVTGDTVLVGKDAVLDSLGVVSLIVEVEQRVESEHGVSVTLANDKAMSQRNSPFRTVSVLAEHVVAMVAEESAAWPPNDPSCW
jgi:maltose O-acetyltransferase